MTEDWLFIPGTLCDARVFGPLRARLDDIDDIGGTARMAPAIDTADLPALASRMTGGLGPRLRVVGFSLGCQVAFEIMRLMPRRCTGVALISTTARADAPDMAAGRRAQVDRMRRDGGAALVTAELWDRYVADPAMPHHPAREIVMDMAREATAECFAAQVELAIGRPDSRAGLAIFERPLLVLNGAEDRLTPPDRGAEIAASAPRGLHRVIAGAGHFTLLERSEAVATTIAAWARGAAS